MNIQFISTTHNHTQGIHTFSEGRLGRV